MIWTTQKLMRMLESQPILQIDATHGMVWGSTAKVNVIGFSDLTHKFFPTALCVSSAETIEIYNGILGALPRPKYVLADGDAAITAAVRSAFDPPPRRLMCYPHMIRCVDRKLHELRITGDVRQALKSDIQLLQDRSGCFVQSLHAEQRTQNYGPSGNKIYFEELCKHILLVKHETGAFQWPEEFAALPLNTKFGGRPRKRQLVTRY
ncbi:hypothetical protein Ddc_15375 [Ditylenchus destructor]|nr:hypothetical protein Ddc_15375 [Ditylenchus destructor]